mgnify:CR=1|jgi:hypothetical protein
MNPEDLLAQLRNLDAPAAISGWPPALGWWILASLILATLISFILMTIRDYREGAAARAAKGSIAEAHESYLERDASAVSRATFLQEVNAILKRLAANYEGAEHVAGLTGQAWRRYLSEAAPELNATELEPFVSAIYEAQPEIDVDEVMFSLDILVNRLRGFHRARGLHRA